MRKAIKKQESIASQIFMALLCVYQVAWLQDKSDVKVWEKGRRIGASWVEALCSVLYAALKKSDSGQSSYYLSYNKDMTRQFINDCAWWAKVLGKVLNVACGEIEEVVADYDKDITIFRISFASGNEICALPSEARSLRSKQGRVILDEAAFVEDFPALLKAAMALLMWGGQLVVLSTHNGADNPFNELIVEIRAGKKPYTLFYTDFDDALDGGLYKAICRKVGKKWSLEAQYIWRNKIISEHGENADEELFCIPSQGSGVYLTRVMIESCMHKDIPVFRWIAPADNFVDWSEDLSHSHTEAWCEEKLLPLLSLLPQDLNHFFGSDFGRTGDLSVFMPATEQIDLSLRIPFLVELRNCPHRTQKQISFYILKSLPSFSGAAFDARGNGSFLAEAARQEYGPELIHEVMISEKWYRDITPKLKSRIEDKTIMLPLDAHVMDDLRALKVVRGVAIVPDKRTKDSTGSRHGDVAIAVSMLLYAVDNALECGPLEVMTALPSRVGSMMRGYI